MDYFIYYVLMLEWGGGLTYGNLEFQNLKTLKPANYPMMVIEEANNWFILFSVNSDNKIEIEENMFDILVRKRERR